MKELPTITVKPKNFDAFTPEQQAAWRDEAMRGLHEHPCPNCKQRSGRLYRCTQHRR